MVKIDIDTRRLSLELSYPSLQTDIRVNVELRDQYGCVAVDYSTREFAMAISETLQLHADLFRVEAIEGLPKKVKARDEAFNKMDAALAGVAFSQRWQDHNRDQLDLFDRAGVDGLCNLVSHGLLESPTFEPRLVTDGDKGISGTGNPIICDAVTGKPLNKAQLKQLNKIAD